MKNTPTKRIVQTALFVALAVIVRMFSVMIPIGGTGSMRIGFSEVFTKMPALLFGPLLGGIASGLVDIVSQIVKPEGAYIWPILAVMVCGGALTGFLWKVFKNVSEKKLRIGYALFCVSLAVFATFNLWVLSTAQDGFWVKTLMRLKEQLPFATYGVYGAAVLGFVFLAVDFIIRKKSPQAYSGDFLQLIATIFISDIFVTTANTFVLRAYYEGLAKLPFMMVYIPRLIPDFVSTVIFAYLISLLLKIYRKVIK